MALAKQYAGPLGRGSRRIGDHFRLAFDSPARGQKYNTVWTAILGLRASGRAARRGARNAARPQMAFALRLDVVGQVAGEVIRAKLVLRVEAFFP